MREGTIEGSYGSKKSNIREVYHMMVLRPEMKGGCISAADILVDSLFSF